MTRPNILILYTDQQRWDALGANGNAEIKTPHLDRLAATGVNYDHHFVHNPVCMPSRVSFLTGQYPSALHITHMGVPVPEDTITLPRMVRNYGYRTANIGKLHFLPHANRDHREIHPDYGFDHLEISDEPGCYEDAYRAWVRHKAPDQMDFLSAGLPPATAVWQRSLGIRDGIVHPEDRRENLARTFRGRSDCTHTAFVAEQTMEFIARHHDRPFLCIAGFYAPHSPFIAPQEFMDLYDPEQLAVPKFPPEVNERRTEPHFSDAHIRDSKRGYYAMISEVDHYVGRLLQQLDDLGIADDTIVVFTSDHGEWLGEHLLYGKGYPASDCISRVPLIIRWPGGGFTGGTTVSGIVEAIDVVPTLLAGAGIPLPPHLQGRPLPPLSDATAMPGLAVIEHDGWKALRTPGFRYIAHANGKESLFDIEHDPGEYHNIADDPAYAAVLAEHRHRLLHRLLETERPLPRIWPY